MTLSLSMVSRVGLILMLVFLPTQLASVNVVRKEMPSTKELPQAHLMKQTASPPSMAQGEAVPVPHRSLPLPRHTPDNTFSKVQACSAAVSVVIGIVFFLYRSKGPLVVVKVIVYLLALTTMKGAVKVVQDGNSFTFPLFLTMTHFASGALVAFGILIRGSVVTGETMVIPSIEDGATKFVPIAMAFGSSIAMNNIALVHSTSAFVEIVSAAGPIVAVLVMLAMKQPFDLKLLGPCFLVLAGCALTSNGEPHFSMIGLVLATGANVPRALKTVLQHMLLKSDPNARVLSPVEVLAWTCLPSTLLMLVWSCAQEGSLPWHQWYQHGIDSQLTGAILISCVNACILNTAVLFVVKDLGAVGAGIVAQIKSVLVILGGMFFLNEQVSRLEFVGFFTIMIGVYAYNDIEARSKAKSKAESGPVEETVPLAENIK